MAHSELTVKRPGASRRSQSRRPIVAVLFAILACPAGSFLFNIAAAEPNRKVDFNFEVRPILSDKCFNCHGPDPRQRKAGLRLDTKEGAFGINKSGGHAVVAGNLEDSDLVARITAGDESERMPPSSLGRPLSADKLLQVGDAPVDP